MESNELGVDLGEPLGEDVAGVAAGAGATVGDLERGRKPRPARSAATAASVTRKVDTSGHVCFAGTSYRNGNVYRRCEVQVAIVGDTVEISIGNELIRSQPVCHDHTREHGVLANAGGRPNRTNAA